MAEMMHGIGAFALYVAPLVVILIAVRRFSRIPDELFRKLLHFVLLGAYPVLLYAFEHWYMLVIFATLLIALFYPAFMLLGRIPQFSAFVNERKAGEFKSSLVLAMLVLSVSAAICWGWLGDRLLVIACIYAWGIGDGLAALVGKRFGRHKVKLRLADGHKSWEGTATMFTAAFLSVLIVLLMRGGLGAVPCAAIALIAAAVTAFVELCATGGMDTVLCPAAAMAAILPLVHLFGG